MSVREPRPQHNRRGPVAALALGALVCASAVTPLLAQEHPIAWSLLAGTGKATQGERYVASLHATIPFGWHLYSLTQPPGGPVVTTIKVSPGGAFALAGHIAAPDPDVAPDKNFEILTETYSDSVTFSVPVIPLHAGPQTLRINVAYQTCTDRYCLPPTADAVEIHLDVAAGAGGVAAVPPPVIESPVAQAPSAQTTSAPATPIAAPVGGGTTTSLPLFLWLAAVMGALSLLTPCVFPMIPITASYFTRSNETSSAGPARNALIYAGGIMATFTVLGMGIAVLVGAGGINRFAANPWVNLVVTGIFVAFALNLFGVYQFTVPGGLLTRLDGASRRGGETAGILLMGLTFTLTSFTCTAPFVGTLLVMAAQGSWVWPLLGLLVFSAVFALPFFFLALVPSAIARLPRSGSWLNDVKVVMGFIELATAMKFLSNADLVLRWGVFTRNLVLAVWLIAAVLTAWYLMRLPPFAAGGSGTERRRPGPIRLVFALAALALGVDFGRGLGGARMGEFESFLPPPEGSITTGTVNRPGELSWMINDYPGGLALARAQHKSLVVDFTGYTCTNCRWMEANMFPRPDVKAELEKYIRVRLYTDGQGEKYLAQQKMELDKFGTVALPYYAVMDTLGNPQAQFLGMTRSSGEFIQFLSHGRSSVTP